MKYSILEWLNVKVELSNHSSELKGEVKLLKMGKI